MSYDDQFADFNPLTKAVPLSPISSELPDIAKRAMTFLKDKTIEELIKQSYELNFSLMEAQGLHEPDVKAQGLLKPGAKPTQFGFMSSDFEALKESVGIENTLTVREKFALIAMWRVIDAWRIGKPIAAASIRNLAKSAKNSRHPEDRRAAYKRSVLNPKDGNPSAEDFERLSGASEALFEANAAISHAEALRSLQSAKTLVAKLGAQGKKRKYQKIYDRFVVAYDKLMKSSSYTIDQAAELLAPRFKIKVSTAGTYIRDHRREKALAKRAI